MLCYVMLCYVMLCYVICIGVDFGGQPGHVPNNLETPMHLSLFTIFCKPNILVCPTNICHKSTPVVVWIFV